MLQRPTLQWAFTALACLVGGWAAYGLVESPSAPAVFWPPVGLALGAVMLWGLHVAVAAALGTTLAVLLQEGGLVPALLLGLACATHAIVGRALLAWAGAVPRLEEVADLFRLVLYGGLLAALVAMLPAHLALAGVDGFWQLSLPMQASSLVFSHLAVVLTFTTLMLCLPGPSCPWRSGWGAEGGGALLALAGMTLLLAHPEIFGLAATPMRPYPLLPILLWLALRADVRHVALGMTWVYAVMSAHVDWGHGQGSMLLDEYWLRPLHGFVTVVGMSFLALAVLMGVNRRLATDRLAEAAVQRDALVREVHHRIKNNLQIVAGLLRRDAARQPEIRPMLESAINQVQSIAVVHGLHGRVVQSGVMLCELLPAIARAISELSAVPVALEGIAEGEGQMRVQESETVVLALILNELISNAVKHMGPASQLAVPTVSLLREGDTGLVRIANSGRLPEGFDFARGVGLGTGLGLVKALQPACGLQIAFQQLDGQVLTEMRVAPPVLLQAA